MTTLTRVRKPHLLYRATLRDKLAVPVINFVSLLAGRHYRHLVKGALEYGFAAAARDERIGMPPPPPLWKSTLQPLIDELADKTHGVIDPRVFEQGLFWIDQYGTARLLEDLTYDHLGNIEQFLVDSADVWFHDRTVGADPRHDAAWVAILGHVPDTGTGELRCEADDDQWDGCAPSRAWMNERPLVAHIRNILAARPLAASDQETEAATCS